jgi:signal transduction histidine kinase
MRRVRVTRWLTSKQPLRPTFGQNGDKIAVTVGNPVIFDACKAGIPGTGKPVRIRARPGFKRGIMDRDMHRELGGWLHFLPALSTLSRPCLRVERVQRSGAPDVDRRLSGSGGQCHSWPRSAERSRLRELGSDMTETRSSPPGEQRADASGEIRRLQSCISDLISVQALPAIWAGHDASRILSILLEALLGMLKLDFAYARVIDTPDGAIEVLRVRDRRPSGTDPSTLEQTLGCWLRDHEPLRPMIVRNPIHDGELSIAPMRLGTQVDIGVLVVGWERAEIPTTIEMLLLRVAANQVTIALHESNLSARQRRMAQELEHRVAERTAQLMQVQEDLAHVARVSTMGELTASIAHEVNQPLAAVTMNADACRRWLMHEVPNLVEARAALERVIWESGRASDVISRTRALSRKTTPQTVRLQLNDVVDEVLALVQNKVASQQISLTIDLSSTLPEVHGDRVQLQQVLLNLIINAIDAIHPVVERPRELKIRTSSPSTGEVQLMVRDSGSGLDPLAQSRLFEPFFTTKPDGMGLGLSISRRIVEAHGGQIRAMPNPDYGTTFEIDLPPAPRERAG